MAVAAALDSAIQVLRPRTRIAGRRVPPAPLGVGVACPSLRSPVGGLDVCGEAVELSRGRFVLPHLDLTEQIRVLAPLARVAPRRGSAPPAV